MTNDPRDVEAAKERAVEGDQVRALLIRARDYVTETLDAHHHDGCDLLKEINAALENPRHG